MSVTDSEANFKARASALSIDSAIIDAFVRGGVNTLSKYAFCSSFVPGAADETPFTQAVQDLLGRAPTVGELSGLRRLFHEAFAMSAVELKLSVERTDDAPIKRLTQPERAERLAKQQARLIGLRIEGKLEPSDRLIDRVVSMYEENRLSYIELSKCTHKEQEVLVAGSKEDRQLSIDATGNVKIKDKELKLEADLSSDLLVRQAMQRRGLAFDQGNILSYLMHDRWIEKVFDARLENPPDGYGRITHQQNKTILQKQNKKTKQGKQYQQNNQTKHAKQAKQQTNKQTKTNTTNKQQTNKQTNKQTKAKPTNKNQTNKQKPNQPTKTTPTKKNKPTKKTKPTNKNKAKPSQAKQNKQHSTKPSKTKPNSKQTNNPSKQANKQPKPKQTSTRQDNTKHNKTKQANQPNKQTNNKAKHHKTTKQSKAEQSRAEQSRAEQSKAKQRKQASLQHKAKQRKPKARQGDAEQRSKRARTRRKNTPKHKRTPASSSTSSGSGSCCCCCCWWLCCCVCPRPLAGARVTSASLDG